MDLKIKKFIFHHNDLQVKEVVIHFDKNENFFCVKKFGDQNSPPHPFLVTLEPSRFQVEFIMTSKYLSSSMLIETLL